MHILIMGAGLAGISAAAALAKKNCDITLIDAADSPAASISASFANGGHLSAGDAHPWASPESLWHIARGMISPHSPFRFSPRFDIAQWQFLWRFYRASQAKTRLPAARLLAELSTESLDLLEDIKNFPPPETWAKQKSGVLHLFRHARDQHTARALAESTGLNATPIAAHELAELEPALAKNIYQSGLFFPKDMIGDAQRFVQAQAEKLQKGEGEDKPVRFLMGHEITGAKIEKNQLRAICTTKEDIEADLFILATGAASANLAKKIFPPEFCPLLPLFPVMGYSLTQNKGQHPPRMGLLDATRRIVVSPLGEHIRAAGMADIGGYDARVRPARVKALQQTMQEMLPAAASGTPEFWAGARPMTPDGLPLLGFAHKNSNLMLHTGHGALGWTLCHATANLIAQWIETEEPESHPFQANRFSWKH